jgi:hypothetical protein
VLRSLSSADVLGSYGRFPVVVLVFVDGWAVRLKIPSAGVSETGLRKRAVRFVERRGFGALSGGGRSLLPS